MLDIKATLDSIADYMEGLSTTSYQDAADDRWHRARGATEAQRGARNLEFWLQLLSFDPHGQEMARPTLGIRWLQRYNPDDSYTSQARLLTAGMTLVSLLPQWGGVAGARIIQPTIQSFDHSQPWGGGLFVGILHLGTWR